MPQTSDNTIKPVTSGALDNPNAPQSSLNTGPIATFSSLQDDASYFPLLGKSPGFADAMIKANKSGDYDLKTTMPLPLVMNRNLRVLEDSDLYKNATPDMRIKYQAAFYKKYVEPLARSTKTNVPFDQWLKDRGMYWQYKTNPEKQNKPFHGLIPNVLLDTKKEKEQSDALSSGVLHTLLKTAEAIENATIKFKEVTKDLSLGAAMLNAEIMPHMGPIIMTPHYEDVRQKNDTLQQYLKADEWIAQNGYKQNVSNRLLRSTGEMAGQIPAFMASDGLLEGFGVADLLGISQASKAKGIEAAVKPTAESMLKKIASKSVYNAAQGYLVGSLTGENATQSAKDFGVGTALIETPLLLFGKMFSWGGGKLINAMADKAGEAIKTGSIETKVSPVTTALAGSQKQKISAATVQALNDLTGGNFSKASDIAKKQALSTLAKKAPELANQTAFIEKTAIGADAAAELVRQRSSVPELDNVLKKMEAVSKSPTHETVANALHDSAKADMMRRLSDKWVKDVFSSDRVKNLIDKDIEKHTGVPTRRATDIVPGAAGAKSLEFGENLSRYIDGKLEKLGMGKVKFEQRKDKFLFFLNVLQTEQQQLGPSAERNKTFHILLNKLQEEFPGDQGRLPNLLQMSDKIWSDMDTLSKSGHMKEGEVFRYWRQHSRPGQSPFSWEVEATQQAAKKEEELARSAKEVSQKTPEEIQAEKEKALWAKASHTETKRDTNVMASALKELYPGKKIGELSSTELSKVAQRAGEMAKELNKK